MCGVPRSPFPSRRVIVDPTVCVESNQSYLGRSYRGRENDKGIREDTLPYRKSAEGIVIRDDEGPNGAAGKTGSKWRGRIGTDHYGQHAAEKKRIP